MTTTRESAIRRTNLLLAALLALVVGFTGLQVAAAPDASAAIKGYVIHDKYSFRSGVLVKCSNGKNYSVKRGSSSADAGCKDVDFFYTPKECYSNIGISGMWVAIGNWETARVQLTGKNCQV